MEFSLLMLCMHGIVAAADYQYAFFRLPFHVYQYSNVFLYVLFPVQGGEMYVLQLV